MTFVASLYERHPIAHRHVQRADDHNRLIAEATEPHLATAIRHALVTARNSVTDAAIYSGMANGDLGAALRPVIAGLRDGLGSAKLFLANAHMQAHALTMKNLLVRKAGINFDLGLLPEPTQDALADYDAGLIRDVTDDVQGTVEQVVTRGMQEGWSPAKMARSIRGSIGLTDTQEAAVNNFRSMLQNGSPDALTRELRDARFDPTVQDAVEGIKPLSGSQIDDMVSRYEDRYLNFRANTIARYESLHVSNQGSFDAVQDAIDNGDLDPADVTSMWMIADDEITCPACRSIVDLQPDGVPYGEEFQWSVAPQGKRGRGRSGTVLVGPLHPACRCTTTYIIGGQ